MENIAPIVGEMSADERTDLIEALRRFYTEVIGLQVGPRPPFDSPGHWLYAGPVDLLHLTVAQEVELVLGQYRKQSQSRHH